MPPFDPTRFSRHIKQRISRQTSVQTKRNHNLDSPMSMALHQTDEKPKTIFVMFHKILKSKMFLDQHDTQPHSVLLHWTPASALVSLNTL